MFFSGSRDNGIKKWDLDRKDLLQVRRSSALEGSLSFLLHHMTNLSPTASPQRPPRLGLRARRRPRVPGPAERLQRRGAQTVEHGHPRNAGGAEGSREPHQQHLYQQQSPVHRLRVSVMRGRFDFLCVTSIRRPRSSVFVFYPASVPGGGVTFPPDSSISQERVEPNVTVQRFSHNSRIRTLIMRKCHTNV